MKMKKIEIIPAILPRDFSEINEKVELVKGFVKNIQIDICDGHFVPSFTWPYKKHDDTFEKMLREEEGLPDWQDIDYEFDLMVDHPEKVIDDWVAVGATRIILHAEAKGDIASAVKALLGRAEVGLAFNIETEVVMPAGVDVSFIQLMGIDRVGFQGQDFDAKVIDKVKVVRKKYPNITISIDGGVSLETAPKLVAAGANRLVVGSAIFDSENPIDTVMKFKSL